jgi:hypothetical protein
VLDGLSSCGVQALNRDTRLTAAKSPFFQPSILMDMRLAILLIRVCLVPSFNPLQMQLTSIL